MPLYDDLHEPLDEKEAGRRRFLSLCGAGALAAAVAGTGLVGLRYLSPNVLFEEETRFKLGRPGDYAVGSVTPLPRRKLYVVRTARGFVAMSAVCTHLGCMTQFEPAGERIFCPCHGSRFSPDGKVAGGPAPRPLPRYELALDDGWLVVDTKRQVADDFVLEVPA